MDISSAIDLKTKGWIVSESVKMKESHPDDLINAWEMGVNKGMLLKDKIVKQYFEQKANKSLEMAEKLFHILNNEIKINCKVAYLRINDIDNFDFLFLVDLESYLTDKLKKSYEEALKLKKECKSDDIDFNFVFKPLTDNTIVENIVADGYFYSYAHKTRKT